VGVALKDGFRVVLVGRNNERNMKAQEATGCEALPMDVVNIESVRDTFSEVRPDVVVHAAATKYVDLSERQPMECLDVNILGSQNIARVSVEKNVQLVIGMSTDKASPPVGNTYGLTKALMERVFCAMNGKAATRFMCVRHGNIAWSTGSVFPIWKRMQETAAGVIGSTGPDMTRYFSTVSEAVALVKTAVDNAERFQGKVLMREMKAARIRDILELWVEHNGGSWHQIDGRPGERSHEYMIGEPELPYTSETDITGHKHYVISFNEPAENALTRPLCSADAPRLSDEEMLDMIKDPPPEEL
jgi:UDP-N-acetylglucosamine 4,6-dehydratase/UDP-glucose 4-epimerase